MKQEFQIPINSRVTIENGVIVIESMELKQLKQPVEEHPEDLKEGDLVICWDHDEGCAIISQFMQFHRGDKFGQYETVTSFYNHAVKFESIEQYKRIINWEI